MSRSRLYMVMGVALLSCGIARAGRSQEFTPRALSPFEAQKARTLLRERVPCLGCHQLDGEGGRLGPDLGASSGTTAAFVYAMIRDPQRMRPGSAMPKVPMSPETLEITNHELERFGRHRHFGHRTARPHPLWVSDHRIDERCGCARRRPEIGTEPAAFPIQLVTTKTRQSLAQQGPRLLSFKGGESARREFLATTGARNST